MANGPRKKCREASVREIARLTGYSPAHVCYTRRGLRISRPLRAKMAKLGLKFKEECARNGLRTINQWKEARSETQARVY